jgi:hypothetical protein
VTSTVTDAVTPAESPAYHRARTGQPDTAHDAARANRPARRMIRERVRDLLRNNPDGLTDDELAELCADLTTIRHSVATRRGEWAQAGHVVDTGHRRRNARGSRCVVWAWTDEPIAQAATGPRPGSRGTRGGPPTESDRSTVDVALLAQPLLVDYCAICGALDGAPHWVGCPDGDRAPVDDAGRLARLERVLFTSPTLFDA